MKKNIIAIGLMLMLPFAAQAQQGNEVARQQQVEALERFEADFNNGAKGQLHPMTPEAWNALLEATMEASTIKDFGKNRLGATLSAEEMNAAVAAYEDALDSAAKSVALYRTHSLLFGALNAWNAEMFPAEKYNTEAILASDELMSAAVSDMDKVFMEFRQNAKENQDVTLMAGENIDFEMAQSANVHGNVYAQPGWEMNYVYNGTEGNKAYSNLTTKTDGLRAGTTGRNALYLRDRWAGGGSVAQVTKTFALPSGSYDLSVWMKYVKGTTGNLCYYEVNGKRTSLTAAVGNWSEVKNTIELGRPSLVTLSFGVSEGNDMDVYVDDITLSVVAGTGLTTYERTRKEAKEKGTQSIALASALKEFSAETLAEAVDAGYDIETAIAVLNNAMAMADAQDKANGLMVNADFKGGVTNGTVKGSGGQVKYPAGWTFSYDFEGWNDCNVIDGNVFNMWAGTIKKSDLTQEISNLPNGTYKISADFVTDYPCRVADGYSWIGLYGIGSNTSRSANIDVEAENVFKNHSVYVSVNNHKLTVGLRSDKAYYKMKNLLVEMIDAETYKAEVAKGCIYQDLAWTSHENLEYDLTAEKYADAEDVDLRSTGFVQQSNALIKASKEGQIAGNNVIVSGTCANLSITDKAPFQASADFTATAATYERSMSNEWGTVLLPYEVSSDETVQFYTLSSVSTDNETGIMTFTKAESLPAGTPGVFIKLDEAAESIAFNSNNVTVAAGTGETLETGIDSWSLKGTYSALKLDAATASDELYYIASNKFWHATGSLDVAPFRAYFTAPKSAASPVRAFILVTDEDASSVTLVPTDKAEQEVYTLSGIRLNSSKNLKPGIYIINNKKVVVK